MLIAQNLNAIQDFAEIPFQYTIKTPADLISVALPYIFGAAGIALLIYLITGGLGMMLSKGDPKAMQSAQGKITNALLGFVIVFISYFVVKHFGQVFGLKDFF